MSGITQAQTWASQQTLFSDIMNRQKPEWLIEGMVPQGSITLVSGLPSTAKSFLVQSWAASIATGNHWMSRETKQGVVAYLALEGNPRKIVDRFQAWAKDSGRVIEPRNLPLLLEFDLRNPDHAENPKAGLHAGVSLVIIDTLAKFAKGLNLSSQSDVSLIEDFAMSVIRESKGLASVVIVAHSPRSDETRVSGSVQLDGMADLVWNMEKRNKSYKATNKKNKDGDEGESLAFELKLVQLEDGDTSAVLTPTEDAGSSTASWQDFSRLVALMDNSSSWFPQSGLIKTILDCGLRSHDSSARDLLKKAVSEGLLEKTGTRTGTRFRITNHEESRTTIVHDAVSQLSRITEPKGSDDCRDSEDDDQEIF
jgi:hypothetical protein